MFLFPRTQIVRLLYPRKVYPFYKPQNESRELNARTHIKMYDFFREENVIKFSFHLHTHKHYTQPDNKRRRDALTEHELLTRVYARGIRAGIIKDQKSCAAAAAEL